MRYGLNVFNYAMKFLFFLEKLLYYYVNNYNIVIQEKNYFPKHYDYIYFNFIIMLHILLFFINLQ